MNTVATKLDRHLRTVAMFDGPDADALHDRVDVMLIRDPSIVTVGGFLCARHGAADTLLKAIRSAARELSVAVEVIS